VQVVCVYGWKSIDRSIDVVPDEQCQHTVVWNQSHILPCLFFTLLSLLSFIISVDDVYACCEKLEKAGVTFKKKPNEGRMKGLAFVYDPDGYWVELVKRGDDANIPNEYNFSQTMLRIKDPFKSLAFYQKMGMKVLTTKHFDDFSLYFLGSSTLPDDADVKTQFAPVLELTHNHGTENDDVFQLHTGNEKGRQGFGHIGFLVNDVYEACDALRPLGYGFRKVIARVQSQLDVVGVYCSNMCVPRR
jgi:lactoylglutathione lyase